MLFVPHSCPSNRRKKFEERVELRHIRTLRWLLIECRRMRNAGEHVKRLPEGLNKEWMGVGRRRWNAIPKTSARGKLPNS